MNPRHTARQMFDRELAAYRTARSQYDAPTAWRRLERAHIVSQPYLALHLGSHWQMLKFAVDQRDPKEIMGQVARLALAPLGSLTGRIPVGNTGRANVSAFQPMPIPDDLRAAIEAAPE